MNTTDESVLSVTIQLDPTEDTDCEDCETPSVKPAAQQKDFDSIVGGLSTNIRGIRIPYGMFSREKLSILTETNAETGTSTSKIVVAEHNVELMLPTVQLGSALCFKLTPALPADNIDRQTLFPVDGLFQFNGIPFLFSFTNTNSLDTDMRSVANIMDGCFRSNITGSLKPKPILLIPTLLSVKNAVLPRFADFKRFSKAYSAILPEAAIADIHKTAPLWDDVIRVRKDLDRTVMVCDNLTLSHLLSHIVSFSPAAANAVCNDIFLQNNQTSVTVSNHKRFVNIITIYASNQDRIIDLVNTGEEPSSTIKAGCNYISPTPTCKDTHFTMPLFPCTSSHENMTPPGTRSIFLILLGNTGDGIYINNAWSEAGANSKLNITFAIHGMSPGCSHILSAMFNSLSINDYLRNETFNRYCNVMLTNPVDDTFTECTRTTTKQQIAAVIAGLFGSSDRTERDADVARGCDKIAYDECTVALRINRQLGTVGFLKLSQYINGVIKRGVSINSAVIKDICDAISMILQCSFIEITRPRDGKNPQANAVIAPTVCCKENVIEIDNIFDFVGTIATKAIPTFMHRNTRGFGRSVLASVQNNSSWTKNPGQYTEEIEIKAVPVAMLYEILDGNYEYIAKKIPEVISLSANLYSDVTSRNLLHKKLPPLTADARLDKISFSGLDVFFYAGAGNRTDMCKLNEEAFSAAGLTPIDIDSTSSTSSLPPYLYILHSYASRKDDPIVQYELAIAAVKAQVVIVGGRVPMYIDKSVFAIYYKMGDGVIHRGALSEPNSDDKPFRVHPPHYCQSSTYHVKFKNGQRTTMESFNTCIGDTFNGIAKVYATGYRRELVAYRFLSYICNVNANDTAGQWLAEKTIALRSGQIIRLFPDGSVKNYRLSKDSITWPMGYSSNNALPYWPSDAIVAILQVLGTTYFLKHVIRKAAHNESITTVEQAFSNDGAMNDRLRYAFKLKTYNYSSEMISTAVLSIVSWIIKLSENGKLYASVTLDALGFNYMPMYNVYYTFEGTEPSTIDLEVEHLSAMIRKDYLQEFVDSFDCKSSNDNSVERFIRYSDRGSLPGATEIAEAIIQVISNAVNGISAKSSAGVKLDETPIDMIVETISEVDL